MKYICINEMKSYSGDILFVAGKGYSFDSKKMTKDELGCIRYFNSKEMKKVFEKNFKRQSS